MSTTPGPSPLYALTPNQVIRTEGEQWRQVIRQALTEARCAIPGFLTKDMDAVEQTVTVQVAIQERVRVVPQGVPSAPVVAEWWDVPPIVHVPIMIPRGGGYSITLPLKKGDEGMLIFCDACIDLWWQNGQTNSPVADNTGASSGSQRQNEIRRHYVHDCGFYPGLWNHKNLLEDYAVDSLQVRSDDGSAFVDVADEVVTVSGATEVAVEAPLIALDASGGTKVQITAPLVSADNGGAAQALMTDTFYQWYITNIQPFLVSKGYAGPAPPVTGCETTVLKGQ